MRKLFCELGYHSWIPSGYNSVINPLPIEVCKICGVGQQWNIAGFCIRYTKEEVNKMKMEVVDEFKRKV